MCVASHEIPQRKFKELEDVIPVLKEHTFINRKRDKMHIHKLITSQQSLELEPNWITHRYMVINTAWHSLKIVPGI